MKKIIKIIIIVLVIMIIVYFWRSLKSTEEVSSMMTSDFIDYNKVYSSQNKDKHAMTNENLSDYRMTSDDKQKVHHGGKRTQMDRILKKQ